MWVEAVPSGSTRVRLSFLLFQAGLHQILQTEPSPFLSEGKTNSKPPMKHTGPLSYKLSFHFITK